MNKSNINLPAEMLNDLTAQARIIAENSGATDVDMFVSGFIHGYNHAMIEIGAVESGDTEAEMAFLKRHNKF